MKKVYINGMGSVSAQDVYNEDFPENITLNSTLNVLPLFLPAYKDYIAPGISRRMATGVKNAIVASSIAIKEAGSPEIDAIIAGTGVGCIKDSEHFLKAIIDNKEEFLTPTAFIQSTHNTAGAQIALGLACKGYNFTYVNGAISFESCLVDGLLQIQSDEANTILVGGVEESAEFTFNYFKLAGMIKTEEDVPSSLLESTTKAAVYGEGATFFILDANKTQDAYAELKAVSTCNTMDPGELDGFIDTFLSENGLSSSEIDAVVLGYNGDTAYDGYYRNLSAGKFCDTPQVYYKHLSGEYNTSSAFGLWIASTIIKSQKISPILKVNAMEKDAYKTILLYNQYLGKDHSLTLLSQC